MWLNISKGTSFQKTVSYGVQIHRDATDWFQKILGNTWFFFLIFLYFYWHDCGFVHTKISWKQEHVVKISWNHEISLKNGISEIQKMVSRLILRFCNLVMLGHTLLYSLYICWCLKNMLSQMRYTNLQNLDYLFQIEVTTCFKWY